MFGKAIPLFRLSGFAIRLDPSWFILAVLVAWSLATQLFPFELPGWSRRTHWLMGIAGAVLLFASIVAHEFAHAITARRYDIRIRGITLFIFGGIAEMESEPPSARSEFMMAAAGPVASLAIGAVGFAIVPLLDASPPVHRVVSYVATINLVLAIFNCAPAFPLDGGRMLRAALWHRRGDLRSATRTAARLGGGFGLLLFGLALLSVLDGEIIGGIWLFLIGMFVRNAARGSYQQVLLRETLQGEPVRRFMHTDPVLVPAGISVQSLVEDYVYRHHHKLYPVVDDGRLVGCITLDTVKSIPREQWSSHSVAELADACTPETTIGPDTDAMSALARMRRGGRSRLLVVEGDRLVGILTRRDLLDFLALKVDLEG